MVPRRRLQLSQSKAQFSKKTTVRYDLERILVPQHSTPRYLCTAISADLTETSLSLPALVQLRFSTHNPSKACKYDNSMRYILDFSSRYCNVHHSCAPSGIFPHTSQPLMEWAATSGSYLNLLILLYLTLKVFYDTIIRLNPLYELKFVHIPTCISSFLLFPFHFLFVIVSSISSYNSLLCLLQERFPTIWNS